MHRIVRHKKILFVCAAGILLVCLSWSAFSQFLINKYPIYDPFSAHKTYYDTGGFYSLTLYANGFADEYVTLQCGHGYIDRYTRDGKNIRLEKTPTVIHNFRENAEGLVDNDGEQLYAENSPNIKTILAFRAKRFQDRINSYRPH